jgi:hypothetical protein
MRTKWALLCCVLALAACGRQSPIGFRLPEGNPDKGREAFVSLRCNSCHTVDGMAIEHLGGPAHVALGGETTRIRTYGELVTSIINPSHKIAPVDRAEGATAEGESLMSYAYLNDVVTVQQLIDLVAFLQPTYQIVPPPSPRWAMYQ